MCSDTVHVCVLMCMYQEDETLVKAVDILRELKNTLPAEHYA